MTASLEIPTTVEGYRELEKFLDSVKQKSLDEWMDYYRMLCLEDLYFLFRYVLSIGTTIHSTFHTPIADHPLFIDRCKATQLHIALGKGVDPSTRRSGKSELRTCAAPIWIALNNPNVAISVISCEKALALRHLRRIKNELEQNSLLKHLFEDLLWTEPLEMARRDGISWSVHDGLCIRGRTINRSNQTFEANALYGGGPIGSGYEVICADDVERRDRVQTTEGINELDKAFSEAITLLTPIVMPRPVVLVSNTRFAEGGLIQRLMDRYSAEDPRLVFMVPGEIIDEDHEYATKYCYNEDVGPNGGRVTWPHTAEFLRTKYEESPDKAEYMLQFGCTYKSASDQALAEGKINWYTKPPKEMAEICRTYICIDTARGKHDYTAIIVWGLTYDKRKVLLDAVVEKLDVASPEFVNTLFRLAMEWNQLSIGTIEIRIEEAGPSAWAETIGPRLRAKGCFIPVRGVHVTAEKKKDKFISGKANRIYDRWAPMLNHGEVWMPLSQKNGGHGIPYDMDGTKEFRDIIDYFLEFELRPFPLGKYDHMLDAGGLLNDPKTNEKHPLQYGDDPDSNDEDEYVGYSGSAGWMSA